MKNLIVLAVAALFATNAVAAEMKWNGSAGWRYAQKTLDDSLGSLNSTAGGKDVSTTKQKMHQMRANLGVMGGWEHVEYGFGFRTQNAGSLAVNDDYTTLAGTAADIGIGLDQAWFRYVRDFGSVDMGLTIGRQKNALAYDSTWETNFDNDVRWDGFGWNFKFGMFGFNAAQYVLGSVRRAGAVTGGGSGVSQTSVTEATDSEPNTNQRMAMLYAFQPHMNWKFSDEIEAMFAVGYYKWISEGQLANQVGGGVSATNAGTLPALATTRTYKMDNKSQWDFLAQISLPFNLNFVADYVKSNKAIYDANSMAGYPLAAPNGLTPEVSSSALTLGLTYGKLRKAQDFTIGYSYGTKGIGSVMSRYTNDLFQPDNKGHTITAGYAMADNFHLGFRTIMLQEKERINVASATQALGAGAPYANIGTATVGTVGQNANQKMKQNFWELTAGVAF